MIHIMHLNTFWEPSASLPRSGEICHDNMKARMQSQSKLPLSNEEPQ